MTPEERWARACDLFDAVCDLSPSERRPALEKAGAGEDTIHEVLTIFADEESSGGPLARPYFSLPAPSKGEDPTIDRRIGPYRVLRRLGQGGMGAVYLAQRDDGEFEQQVALKLLHPTFFSDQVLRRFRVERQILAKLTHPNVAQLLDGGTTDDGFPYFVMEHVDGRPIDEHCSTHGLSIRERLGLFRSVCEAVSFAHRNLVVHRDLKPANILVTADGQTKLLDFGIAKLLGSGQPLVTGTDGTLMTPPYASPEQIAGEAVDTTSDVYSLGVVLYELLTGRRPHQADSPQELARAIREDEPRRPSTHSERTRRELAGDLDNIVLKALSKEKNRRYQNVDQFSEDVQRYLTGRPVLARPDTWTYRTNKFVQRHRLGVATATLIIALVVAFTVSTLRQNARIVRQYEETVRERDRAGTVTNFLVEVLESSDPRRAKGDVPTVLDVLERTTERLQSELQDEPLIRASLLDAVGRVYRSLGFEEEARSPLEEALALRRAHHGADHPVLAESLHSLANLKRDDGRIEEAERLLREAVDIQRRAFPEGHRDLATGLSNFASFLRRFGDVEEAEELAREAVAMHQRLGEHIELAIALNTLAGILSDKRQPREAEQLYEKSVEMRRKIEGPDDPGLARALNNRGVLLVDQLNRAEEAVPLYNESLRIRRKVYGESHASLVNPLNNLALAFTVLGRYDEARDLFDRALTIYGNRRSRPLYLKNKVVLLAATGEYSACEELIREILPKLNGDERIAEAKSLRGACLAGLGRPDEAAPLLQEGYTTLLKLLGEDDRRTRQAGERLAAFKTSVVKVSQ